MQNIPTIIQLYNGILADLESQFNITIPIVGKNFLRAMAAVQAAKLKLFYLAIGNLQKNIFIDTASSEAAGGTLERFGRVKLGRNPFPAVAGQYTVSVTGTIGGTINAETTFKSNDDSLNPGMLFILDNEHTLVSNPDTIILRALASGLDSKLSIGDQLTATAPIALVDSLATVTLESVQPLAAEDIETYRAAGMNAYRQEPQGGAATDYRLWASDAQGVRRVYPYAKDGAANEINIFVEAVLADSTDGKGTPSAGILTAVESVIELDPDTTIPLLDRGRRPLGVFQVHYLPVTIKTIDIVVTGFVGLTSDIQAAILAALTADLATIRPFVAAADILENQNNIIDVNKISYTIQVANPRSVFTSITLKVNTTPLSSFEFDAGDIGFLNSVTYA